MSHVAGGYKKPTLRKLRGRVNLDQEKGEVTNKLPYMYYMCMGLTVSDKMCTMFQILACNNYSYTGDSVSFKSTRQTNVDSKPPITILHGGHS